MRRQFFQPGMLPPVGPLLLFLIATQVGAAAAADDGAAWPPAPDGTFRADVYPSVRWAVRSLGHDVAAADVESAAGAPPSGTQRTITVFLPSAANDAWRDAVDVIRSEHPRPHLVHRTAELPESERPAAGEVWIGFATRDTRSTRAGWSSGPGT